MADKVTISLDVENNLSAGMDAAAASMKKVGDAAVNVETQVTKAGRSVSSLTNAFSPSTKAANQLAAAQKNLTDATAAYADAVAKGDPRAAALAETIATLTGKVEACKSRVAELAGASDAAGADIAELTARMEKLAAVSDVAARSQKAINDALGVNRPMVVSEPARGPQTDYEKRAEQIAAYGNEMDRLRAKYDPLFAASKQYSDQLEEIDRAEKAGALSTQGAASARDRLTQAFAKANPALEENAEAAKKAGDAHGSAGAKVETMRAAVDVAAGRWERLGSAMVVISERTPAIRDAISSMASSLVNFAGGPLGVATIGMTVAAAAATYLAVKAEDADLRLGRIQARLSGTRNDYQSLAPMVLGASQDVSRIPVNALDVQAQAHVTDRSRGLGVDQGEALNAASQLATSPDFTGGRQQLDDLLKTANELALMFGQKLPDAAKTLADAMSAPGDAAQKLADEGLRTMNQSLADQIKRMDDAGDRAGAFARVQQAIDAATSAAAEHMTPLQKALHDLDEAFNGTGADGKSFGQSLGETIAAGVGVAVEALAKVVGYMEYLRQQRNQDAANAAGGPALLGRTQKDGQRAVGIMQVNPATAADMNYSPTDLADPDKNITAGLTDLNRLYYKYHGNWAQAIAEYRGAPGHDVNSHLVADTFAADPASLANGPRYHGKTVDQLISEQVGQMQRSGLPRLLGGQPVAPNLARIGEQIAVVESNGRQYETQKAGQPTTTISVNPDRNDPSRSYQTSAIIAQRQVDAAIKAADGAGTQSGNLQAAQDEVTKYTQALKDIQNGSTASADAVAKLHDALQKAYQDLANAEPAVKKETDALDAQKDSIDALTAAYKQGGDAILQAKAKALGENQASQSFSQTLPDGSENPAWRAAADAYTSKDHDNLVAQGAQGLAEKQSQNQQELQDIQAQTGALGENDQARQLLITHLNAEHDAMEAVGDVTSQAAQDYIKSADAVAQANAAFEQRKAALNGIQQMFESTFDSIASAIASAMDESSQHAVNFSNVMQSIGQQIATQFLKLAVVTPVTQAIMGALVGGGSGGSASGDTGSAGTASSGASGGSGGLFGGGSLLSEGSSILSLGNTLSGGNLLSTLGINTGGSNILAMIGNETGISSVLGTQITGYAATDTVMTSDLGGLTAGAGSAGTGATLGGLLGGAGAGFAAGTLEDQLFGARNKTAGMIGSGVGSIAGAAIGSIVPGVGTLLGGLIGGALGGGAGFFGPGAQNSYSSTPLTIGSNGQIVVGQTVAQQVDPATVKQEETDTTDNAINLDNLMADFGIQAGFTMGGVQVGTNTPGGLQAANKFASFDQAMAAMTFTDPSNPQINAMLTDGRQQITSPEQLSTLISEVQNFNSQTLPQLANLAAPLGSVNTQIQQIDQQFAQATQQGQALGQDTSMLPGEQAAAESLVQQQATHQSGDITAGYLSSYQAAYAQVSGSPADTLQAKLTAFDQSSSDQIYDLDQQLVGIYGAAYRSTTAYANQMALAEQSLGEQRVAIQQQYNEQMLEAQSSINVNSAKTNADYLTAYAQVTGNPGDSLNAQLAEFDAQAAGEQLQLDESLVNTYGTSYRYTAAYAQQMTQLDQTTAEQRLAIQVEFNNQLLQTANGAISGLKSYTLGLQFGSQSPLTPQAQYTLASQQYQTDLAGAQAGNFQDIQDLQQYAQNFLSTSQAVNGSGTAYVADYENVLNGLSSIANMSPDTLTASVYQQESQSQTATLVLNLQQIVAAIAGVQTQLSQNVNQPSRIS